MIQLNFLKKNQEIIFLLIGMLFFNIFGIYHLAENETVDEHFWKYSRIQEYFSGIKKGFEKNNWKNTRINDKPGVTVALLSGISLPFIPDPQTHEISEKDKRVLVKNKSGEKEKKDLYNIYDINKTFSINFGLRLPILLFNGLLMLPIIFWLLKKSFGSKTAIFSIFFISLNPILIGISQIINPDALLWSLCLASILSFIALLKTREKKFIFLAGVFTGFALLTKYTANLLFVFYPLIFVLYKILEKDIQKESHFDFNCKILTKIEAKFNKFKVFNKTVFFLSKFNINYIISFFSITFISWFVFLLFLPAAIQNPKHFLYGTIYSPALAPISDIFIKIFHLKSYLFISKNNYHFLPMFLITFFVFMFLFIILPTITVKFLNKKFFSLINKLTVIVFLIILFISLFNAWTDQSVFSLYNIRESVKYNNHRIISFPKFKDDNKIIYLIKSILVLSQGFIFSNNYLIIFSVIFIGILLIFNKIKKESYIIYFSIYTYFIFFFGAILSNVFTVVRYVIIIFPLFSLIGGITSVFIVKKISDINYKNKKFSFLINFIKERIFEIILFLIIFLHLISLIKIYPYYFNYENFLLPKKYDVSDSIGYGAYEIAEYLNNLPDAENKVIWTDRLNVCEFFVGKCITGKIYLDYTSLDYLAVTRRSFLTKKPSIITELKDFNIEKTYAEDSLNNPEFEIQIDNRSNNFVKLLKVKY